MKEQDAFFKIVGSGLKILAGGIHAVAEKIDNLASTEKEGKEVPGTGPAPRPTEKTGPRGTTIRVKSTPSDEKHNKNAADAILTVIEASEGNVDVDRLVEETGFERRKIHNTLYRLKKQGKIRNVGKGVYTKW
ncbi:MAG: hypothetical protein R6U38_03745 [Desulfatiglandaceae bacterium]